MTQEDLEKTLLLAISQNMFLPQSFRKTTQYVRYREKDVFQSDARVRIEWLLWAYVEIHSQVEANKEQLHLD